MAVVVLAGGRSRRWNGLDKTAALLAGRPVLCHVVDGVRAAFGADVAVVVVGPDDHAAADAVGPDDVRWVREDPPGGGPVAGLAAGLAALPADVRVVGVIAGDVPFGAPALRRLTRELCGPADADPVDADPVDADRIDAVVGEDPQGRRQPLLGAYRLGPLRAAVAAGPTAGRPVHAVLDALVVRTAPVDDRESLDLDTPADLAVAATFVAP
ncbi:MAG: molybdenum cofactor guanylyltransferase [Kineosporiaceae bacterium]